MSTVTQSVRRMRRSRAAEWAEIRVSCRTILEDLRIVDLSPSDFRLYFALLAYSVQRDTEGFVSDQAFATWGLSPQRVTPLLDSRLMIRKDHGWLIVDYAITQVTYRRAASRWRRKERREERRKAERVSADGPTIHEEGDGETFLYRWYDIDDRLLYIGITNDLETRRSMHRLRSTWSEFAVRSTVEAYPTRAMAEALEVAAINAEQPLFNHVHQDTPEARERLVRYLVAKERFDLLTPLISRG